MTELSGGFAWWMRPGIWIFRHLGWIADAADGYGYQWWMRSFRVRGRDVASYSAEGRGGQFIFVFPDLQMLAVFTGWNDDLSWSQPVQIIQDYVLPAIH